MNRAKRDTNSYIKILNINVLTVKFMKHRGAVQI
jgi:hypothetical protein